jgi:hypothetical protein
MKVNQIDPATIHHLRLMQHYNRLVQEKRIIDNLEEARKKENARRVQELGKGENVDVMV